ncbi:MAG: DUF1028 domain-containing protein [Candidatus Heimdallarchaeota archaeon]|nr:DUF1028 domain-containing protein [Candidatus Heimdallarchaeota archaeon]MCK4770613.1 DUF1028 domain-containing protein [Candidatus Heimdallarchaeota archaeon]
MTFSIVAVDKENKEIGFAGASCIYDAGRIGFVEAELGAISTQALVNWSLGPLGLEKLKEGLSLEEILKHFGEVDEDLESRQLGMVTYEGKVLAFTGSKCFDWAGHKTGKGYTCQGNILAGSKVIEDMAKAFEETQGTLANRLYAALLAGDDAGGDTRGKQSARIIVEKKEAGLLKSDRIIDIKVEDHDEPVKELGRILNVHIFFNTLFGISQKYEDDKKTAISEMEKFIGTNEERYTVNGWSHLGYLCLEEGLEEKAKKYYGKAMQISPGFKTIFVQLPKLGRITEEFVKSVLE